MGLDYGRTWRKLMDVVMLEMREYQLPWMMAAGAEALSEAPIGHVRPTSLDTTLDAKQEK